MSCGYTSLVYNNLYKIRGLSPFYYRWRSFNSTTPAVQYQNQKIIQKTVRVNSSLYTANLGPLTAYTPGVCWNQMSDRTIPSIQKVTIPTGINNSLNCSHYSVTSSKPGSQTPGSKGCDIKHNSYDRYLNRLKGKGPLRRGDVSLNYGKNITFNRSYPVYGGKTIKTNIISNCDCPI